MYTRQFYVPPGMANFKLTFQFAGDDTVAMTLGGEPPFLGYGPAGGYAGPAYSGPYPPSPLVITETTPRDGLYQLEALVANIPSDALQTGLWVKGNVTCERSPVGGAVTLAVSASNSSLPLAPVSAGAIVVATVLLTGGWYGRRRWLR
jgi:hypothetical protein